MSKEKIVIEITRDDKDGQIKTSITNTATEDSGMNTYFAVLQVMLSDKDLIKDYTNAVLDYVSVKEKIVGEQE